MVMSDMDDERDYRPGENWSTYLDRIIPPGDGCETDDAVCYYFDAVDKTCDLFGEDCKWGKCQSCKANIKLGS